MATNSYSRPNSEPDRVWITYGGNCYHSTPTCPALADGQAKARAAGFQPWRVVSTSADRARARCRCLVCLTQAGRRAWGELDDRLLRIAHGNGRPVATIAGMLERTEDEVLARMRVLGLGRAA